jgi:hypothetical protein
MWRRDKVLDGKPGQRKIFDTTQHRYQDYITMKILNTVLG